MATRAGSSAVLSRESCVRRGFPYSNAQTSRSGPVKHIRKDYKTTRGFLSTRSTGSAGGMDSHAHSCAALRALVACALASSASRFAATRSSSTSVLSSEGALTAREEGTRTARSLSRVRSRSTRDELTERAVRTAVETRGSVVTGGESARARMSCRVDEGPGLVDAGGASTDCLERGREELAEFASAGVRDEGARIEDATEVRDEEADTGRVPVIRLVRDGGSIAPSTSCSGDFLSAALASRDRASRRRLSESRSCRAGFSLRSGTFSFSPAGVSRPRSAKKLATCAEGAEGRAARLDDEPSLCLSERSRAGASTARGSLATGRSSVASSLRADFQ